MSECPSEKGTLSAHSRPPERKPCEWAGRLGLLLDPEVIISRLVRGGQEHDIFQVGERVFKVTRNGIFGFSPGIELALVSSGEDARRFQLWEATPLEYLERLDLHNQLVPGLNADDEEAAGKAVSPCSNRARTGCSMLDVFNRFRGTTSQWDSLDHKTFISLRE